MGTVKIQTRTAEVITPARNRIFTSGLECIANVGGGCLEFIMFVNQDIDGHTVRVRLDESVVMPVEALPDAIGKALMALGRQVFVRPDGTITVMH